MLIGMTYDLKEDYLAAGFSEEAAGEFDAAATIDALEAAIRANGHEVDRIGSVKALVGALAAGRRWDLVFNLAEGVSGIARESQVPALLEAYDIAFTFSSADVLIVAMDKALAKLVVRQAGVSTADFVVVRSARDLAAEGTSKGVHETSRVADRSQLTRQCLDVLKTYRQPALVEAYLPGREFTVGLLGGGADSRVVGVAEVTFKPGGDPSAYSFRNKIDAYDVLTLATDEVAKEAGAVALAAWRALGCRDAGRVDIRCDAEGRPAFIEANPLAGLRPDWSELTVLAEQAGLPYVELIGTIIAAAAPRIGTR